MCASSPRAGFKWRCSQGRALQLQGGSTSRGLQRTRRPTSGHSARTRNCCTGAFGSPSGGLHSPGRRGGDHFWRLPGHVGARTGVEAQGFDAKGGIPGCGQAITEARVAAGVEGLQVGKAARNTWSRVCAAAGPGAGPADRTGPCNMDFMTWGGCLGGVRCSLAAESGLTWTSWGGCGLRSYWC